MMVITKFSKLTGAMNTMKLAVTPEQIEAWESGTLIQEVMPHLSAQEREFLITGSTAAEWDAAFGGEE